MTQTKKQSMYEALVNVAVGYIISLISLSIILPLMGIETTASKNIQITLYFTVISIVRSYTLRRYFNKKTEWKWHNVVKFFSILSKSCPKETKW